MSLRLEWNNEQQHYEITPEFAAKLEQLLRIAGETEQVEEGEVALSFVDDAEIQRLNKEYRGLDKPTDVLSFAMREAGEGEPNIDLDLPDEPLGDIIISVQRAMAQSEDYGHSIERELGFLFVHGFLHLIGYDHQDEQSEKEMFARQEHILQQAGLVR